MVSSLNCPSCGAPAPSATAARCEYCGSALTVTACPSCFGPMFRGLQFCPHCGAKGARVVDESGAAIACPGCRAEMRAVQVGATSFHECTSCASTWLDADAFRQLCLNREERGAMTATLAQAAALGVPGATPASATSVGAAVRYVACPACKKTLNRQNFGRRSGVVIDVCKSHGVWFEQGELQSVLAFIDGGGLERARRDEDARQLEERRKLDREFAAAMHESMVLDRAEAGRHHGQHHDDSMLSDALRLLFS